jgi:hypothetical protein
MKRTVTVCILSGLISGALGSIFAFVVYADRLSRALAGNVVGPLFHMSDGLPITLVAAGVVLLIWRAAGGVIAGVMLIVGGGILLDASEAFWNGLFVVSLFALGLLWFIPKYAAFARWLAGKIAGGQDVEEIAEL